MVYTVEKLEGKQQLFIDFFKNLARDLDGRQEDASVKNLFPNSVHGDVATCKDLVGNALVALTGESVTIN